MGFEWITWGEAVTSLDDEKGRFLLKYYYCWEK